MKVLIALGVAFFIGVGCRYFDLPVPSPPVLPGALLVVAMTLGYTSTDRLLSRTHVVTTKQLCGGPTGQTSGASPGDNPVVAMSTPQQVHSTWRTSHV